MAKFGAASRAHLAGVDSRLVRVHEFAIQKYDHTIIDGARTIEEQRKNVARGVSKTMASKHLPGPPENKGRATDSMPYPPIDWQKVEKGLNAVKAVDPKLDVLRFYHFQGYMLGIADHMGIDLRQGIDWNENNNPADQTFFDLPHNELK
jgi:peptidoglycan L-alanyl-D-glutamate endopeptidase CwlK